MEFEKKGTIWAIMVVVFGCIYLFSAFVMFKDIARAIGIEALGEIFTTVFVLVTIFLICYLHDNPFILYSTKEGQRRALIALMVLHYMKNLSDDNLENFETEIRSIMH